MLVAIFGKLLVWMTITSNSHFTRIIVVAKTKIGNLLRSKGDAVYSVTEKENEMPPIWTNIYSFEVRNHNSYSKIFLIVIQCKVL